MVVFTLTFTRILLTFFGVAQNDNKFCLGRAFLHKVLQSRKVGTYPFWIEMVAIYPIWVAMVGTYPFWLKMVET